MTKSTFAAGQVLRVLQNTEYPIFKPKLYVVFMALLRGDLGRKVAILWKKKKITFLFNVAFSSFDFHKLYFWKDQVEIRTRD